MTTTEIDFDARYRVQGWDGVAFRLTRWQPLWEPYQGWQESDDPNYPEDGYWYDLPEGEWVDDIPSGIVLAVAVGDDREYPVCVDDLVKLDDDEYCSCCGQIGCAWGAA